MPRTRSALVLLLTQALACQPVPTVKGGGDGAASPDTPFRASATGGDVLVFPAEPAVKPRRTLPRDMAAGETGSDADTGVEWPELDAEGHFELAGKTLRIHFNRAIAPPAAGVPALTLEPAVDGVVAWPSPWVLTFEAAAAFDPATEHTVRLGELHDTDGKRVAEGWTGVFTAEPRVEIAGKVISYLPEIGKPQVVTVRPEYEPRVGRNVAPRILFDQPVTLSQVAKRVTATVDGLDRPLALTHATADVFEGVKVDRRHVVVAKPTPAPAPGQKLVLAIAEPDGSAGLSQDYDVAAPVTFDGVDCSAGYYDERTCTWKDGTLGLEGGRFAVRFNNPLLGDDKALARLVQVSPQVKNLQVHGEAWRSDGTVWISGDFRSSTRYEVKVGRVRDRWGSRLASAVRFAVDVAPQTASVAMAEGQQVLDEAGSRTFTVTTRNVEEARLDLWEVESSAQAWAQARTQLGARERPTDAPDLHIAVRPRGTRDEAVTTEVDLLAALQPGHTYLARLELETPAFGAKPPAYPEWAMASRPPTALLTPHDDQALAVHVHAGRNETLVHVARLADGRPVAGARVLVDGARVPGLKTGADGLVVLPRSLHDAPDQPEGDGSGHVVEVEATDARAVLALGGGTLHEGELAPELAASGQAPLGDVRALVLSDRGVYRPGQSVGLKGIVQHREHGKLRAAATMPVGLRIHAPTGKLVLSEDGITSDLGGYATRFAVPAAAEIGRYRVELVAPQRDGAVLASYGIQVAEFEPPRFTVDVEARAAEGGGKLVAAIDGRYLFGAAMEDAPVTWTLRRQAAAFPHGPLTAKGLQFRPARDWWDEEEEGEAWLRTGEGQLSAQGRLELAPAVELATDAGPQSFVLEAEVTDESHRAIAGRAAVVLHAAPRYAGLRLVERWLDVGKALPLEVGVIDQAGATVADATVEVRLERLDWRRVRRPGPGGFADEEWREVAEVTGKCKVKATDATACKLVPERSGSYRVSAFVDGRRGGSVRAWAWGEGGGAEAPMPGRRLEIVADRDRYSPGDTAELMVRNPFPAATAILTVEQGGILHHETRTITESAARFSVPLGHEHAPHAHATITLLPRAAFGAAGDDHGGPRKKLKGEARVDWKLGAIRLPVELGDNRLDVVVASDRDRYAPGEEVDVVVDVTRGGTTVANAEVALAVVDEGVLRLTNFHAVDPVPALYPGQGLDLWVDDTRRLLAEQLRRSHVAGDGSGAGTHSLVATRKSFVETALWEPALRTDADGRVHARFTLPDNLTRFRMMAVVIDGEGRGGVHEADFEVQKPLMAIPAVPRFAAIGDRFEAAVLVHNNLDHAETATVSLGRQRKQVELAAGGRARVGFMQTPTRATTLELEFVVADGEGTVRDRVQATVPVQAPGIDERPHLHGAFAGRQEIALDIPQEVFADATGDDHVTVIVGENLWPELGSRVEFLVGYPHGCVEQTTSSTLPLLAAREILPRLGLTRYGDAELREMIAAGVQRLSTMRTSTGGLGYWPGDHEPNPFGTAYATLAIARARALGIEAPEGMIDGMRDYLLQMVEADQLPHGYGIEVRASIALALAELEALPPSVADSLYDTASAQGTFGTATLALALASLPEQDDRVAALLDTLESAFDENGELRNPRGDDFGYYGSDQRSIAQAALALHRLRPASPVLPILVSNLVRRTSDYTTQGTAYGLLALAERIGAAEGSGARQRALLDDVELAPELSGALALGPNVRRYRIPLSALRGRRSMLVLESEAEVAQAFMVSARWRRAPAALPDDRAATTTANGPDLYRVITDAKGRTVDFDAIEPGQVLRVVLLARMPEDLPYERRGYLALTDRLPAGFEAMQPDLWTVATVPELDAAHPLYDALRWTGSTASHVELRDDRAQFYFDQFWGEWVHATYLVRATTPGRFTAPPAMAELMYEPDSAGYSQAVTFTVVQ